MILYFGTITVARDPSDDLNINKKQYEYDALLVGDNHASVPVRYLVKADLFGSRDDFDDTPLRPGSRVLVAFRDSSLTSGVIIACLRTAATAMSKDDGVYRRTRFNKVEQTVDQEGHWILKLDQGEFIKVDKKKITIDNSTGEQVVIDKDAKSILVKAGKDWKTTLGGSMQVDATENVTINCKNATVNASENITAKAGKTASVECTDANVKASSKATVEAANVKITGKTAIDMNEAISPITTELSHMGVVDLITGVPVQGVKKIKAG